METVIRNVGDIAAHDREALEHVLGHRLGKNQRLEIRIVDVQAQPQPAKAMAPQSANGAPALPDWCNVYEGLSDDEIADMETTILQRADLSRPSE